MPNQNQDVPGMLNISGMTHPAGSPRGVLPDDNDAHLENGKARA